MLQTVDTRAAGHAGHSAVFRKSAPYLTLPALKIPKREVVSSGDEQEISILLSELSRRVDLEGVLAQNHIAHAVLKNSVREWLGQFVIPEIDALIEADVTLFPEQKEMGHYEYEYDGIFPEGDWVLLFDMRHVDYHTFDITRQVKMYEEHSPGLGQLLLRAIDRTPYEVATPSYMYSYIRYAMWGDMDNERDYISDCLGVDDEEEIEYILGNMPVTRERLFEQIPAWALKPSDDYAGRIPAEIAKIIEISKEQKGPLRYIHPYANMPAFMLWEDSANIWEETLSAVERDCMEAGNDLRVAGKYWTFSLKNMKELQGVFAEIENHISGFYRLLQALHRIKKRDCV